LRNAAPPESPEQRCLEIAFAGLRPGQCARAATATFILPDDLSMSGYELIASPTLYAGQPIEARLIASPDNDQAVEAALYLRYYNADDLPARLYGPAQQLAPAGTCVLTWKAPDTQGGPIFEIGIEIRTAGGTASRGRVYLDWLDWSGEPDVTFVRPPGRTLPNFPLLYRRAWANAVDHWDYWWNQPFRIIQDSGRGMISTGTRDWKNYTASARVTAAKFHAGGIAVRVQGLRRYYALLLVEENKLRLVKMLNDERILAERDFAWDIWRPYDLRLEADGSRLRAWIDGQIALEAEDSDDPLSGGGVALVVERGHLAAPAVRVAPV